MVTVNPQFKSLSQSVRQKSVGQARGILIVVGMLTLLVNGFMLFNAEHEIDQELEKEVAKVGGWQNVDRAAVEQIRTSGVRVVRVIYGGAALLGAVFIVLGMLVKKYPVPATVLGLLFYIGGTAVFAAIAPETLFQGLIIKIIIVVGLFKSMQAAFAYQREMNTPPTPLPTA